MYREIDKYIIKICSILNLAIPEVYYIYDKKDFILRNSSFDAISYDKRDVGIDVSSIKYLYNENTLYINTSLFSRKNACYALLLRELRLYYQLYQIELYNNGKETDEKEHVIKQWIYSRDKKYNTNSNHMPSENDACAFSTIIMQKDFDIKPNFKHIIYKDTFINKLIELRKQYYK